MKNNFLKTSFLVITLITFLCQCENKNKSPENFTVACNLPLTGNMAIYGEAIKDGITFAVEDLKNNKQLDTLNLNVVFNDNKSINSEAITILNKDLLSTPNVYVSGLDHQTSAIIDKISNAGIPHFTYSWEPFINKKGINNFRTGINLEQEANYYVKFIEQKNPKKIFILHVNDPGSFLQFDSIVIPQVNKDGSKQIIKEQYDTKMTDFKTIVAKIKKFNPDLILVAAYDFNLINIIKDFRNYGVIKNDNIMCSVDLLDAAINLTPALLEGIRVTSPLFIYNQNSNLEWKNRFLKRFNRTARYGDAYAYDMTNIIYNTARKANKDYSANNIINILKNTNLNGITGPLTFNETRDLNLNLDLCWFKNGILTK